MKRILFDVPKWHLYLHREARELLAAAPNDTPVQKFEDELFDRLYSGEVDELSEKKRDARLASWAKSFHDAAGQMPQFERLADECRGDAVATSLAMEKLLDVLNPQIEDEPQEKNEQSSQPKNGAPSKPGPSPVDALRRALIPAIERASRAVDEAREELRGLEGVGIAPGTGSGSSGTLNAAEVRRVLRSVKNDYRLKRILELAGRFRRIAARKRRERVRHGADEIADVETGADIARLLPSELAKLTNPTRRLAFMRDLLERQTLQYQLIGKEPKGKGPLVVCIDKSGSMTDAPDVWATAVALALLEQAQIEKRPFALLCFDYRVTFEAVVKVGEALPKDALMIGCGGGTEIATALSRALDIVEQNRGTALGKADVVLITDGGSDPSRAAEIRARAAELKTHTIGIGIGIGEEWLTPWADEVHCIQSLQTIDEAPAAALFGGES